MTPDLDRRVAITGVGVIGSFGSGTGALWSSVGGGGAKFAPSTRYPGSLPCAEAARPDLRRTLRSGRLSRMSLVSQFAIAAVHPALAQAGLLSRNGTVEPTIGIVYGTSNGPAAATQKIYDDLIERGPGAVKPRVFQESVFNAPASLASIHFGLTGPIQALAVSTCAPSVLYQAQILLARPGIAAVIALCADELCEAIQSALRVLRWQAPRGEVGAPLPPVSGRGAVLSEGAAALVLERGEDALARDAVPLAEMAGAASTNDAWKLIRPARDGRGLAAAMTGCLADAEASPGDVDMVLSASANTDVDDCLEAAAVRSVFGGAAPPVVSTKDHIGHAMGAAAMFDIALAAEVVRRGRAPAAFAAAGNFSDGIRSVLCAGIGLNGLFGAVLIRRAQWQGEGGPSFPG